MADVYGTVQGYKDYHAARGRVITTADETIEGKLLLGSEYIDGRYSEMFPGEKTGRRAQVREWPRINAYDVNNEYIPQDEVPVEAINATYEAIFYEIQTPGILNPTVNFSERRQSVAVEGAVSVTYADIPLTLDSFRTKIPTIDQAIYPILSKNIGAANPLGGRAVRGW